MPLQKPLFILLCVLSLAFQHPARAQFDSSYLKSRITICADSFAMGYRTHNWDLYTRFTYPALIAAYGGKDEFAKFIRAAAPSPYDTTLKQFEARRILQLVKTPRSYQAVLEFLTVTESQGYRFTKVTSLVAECWDGGFFWTFFDPRGDSSLARMIDPDIDPSLHFLKETQKTEKTGLPVRHKPVKKPVSAARKPKT